MHAIRHGLTSRLCRSLVVLLVTSLAVVLGIPSAQADTTPGAWLLGPTYTGMAGVSQTANIVNIGCNNTTVRNATTPRCSITVNVTGATGSAYVYLVPTWNSNNSGSACDTFTAETGGGSTTISVISSANKTFWVGACGSGGTFNALGYMTFIKGTDFGSNNPPGARWRIDGPTVISAPPTTAGNCVMSDVQLVLIARAAGFAETDLATAVAIALAESGGRVNAVRPITANNSYDLGLWAINDKAYPTYDRTLLPINPYYNATTAKAIYSAPTPASWSPWASYTTGSYSKYVARASKAVSDSSGASSALTNCNGAEANTGDADGDGIIDDPNSNDSKYCHWSLNPLDYLKCLFVPSSGATTAWQSQVTTIKANPPVSTVTALVGWVNGILTAVPGAASNLDDGTCHIDSGDCGLSPHAGGPADTPIQWGLILQQAATWTQASAGAGHWLWLAQKVVLTFWFIMSVYNRVTTSLGNKATA